MRSLIATLALALMVFPVLAQESFLTEFQQKWKNAMDYTVELAESMPAEAYDFKPTEEQMTFTEQLLHMCNNMAWLSSSYLGGTRPEADLQKTDYSKAEMLEILREHFSAAATAVADFPAEQLEEEVSFFAGPMSKRQILILMNDHVTHHRGQLIVYARLKGVKPPRFRGW